MVARPRGDKSQLDKSKRSEAQGNAEAVLAFADSKIASEEKQKQNHAHLDDSNATLRGHNGLDPWGGVGRASRNRNHSCNQKHDQTCPLKQDRSQVAQGVKRPKDIEKGLMYHLKPESDADRRAKP